MQLAATSKVTPSVSNEEGHLRSVALCRPYHIDISEEDAASLGFLREATAEKLRADWDRLRDRLEGFGVTVHDLGLDDGRVETPALVNRIYTRDIAAVVNKDVFLGTARYAHRAADFSLGHTQLRKIVPNGTTFISCPVEFGDLLRLRSDTVLMNFGYRTPSGNRDKVLQIMGEQGITNVGVVQLPRELHTAHLDLGLNVFGPERMICSSDTVELRVDRYVDGILKDNVDLHHFCSLIGRSLDTLPKHAKLIADVNFIHLEPDRILTSSRATTLPGHGREHGIHVETVEIDELLSGGGGIRCMTSPLERDNLNLNSSAFT